MKEGIWFLLVILSERSESKNLRICLCFVVKLGRRSLGFASLAQDDMEVRKAVLIPMSLRGDAIRRRRGNPEPRRREDKGRFGMLSNLRLEREKSNSTMDWLQFFRWNGIVNPAAANYFLGEFAYEYNGNKNRSIP